MSLRPDARNAAYRVALRALTAAAVLLAAWAARDAWARNDRAMCYDYYQAWVIGTAVRVGDAPDPYTAATSARLDPLYDDKAWAYAGTDPETQRRSRRLHAAHVTTEIVPASSPWLYTVFGLLATEDYDRDQKRWGQLGLLALGGAVFAFGRLLALPALAIALWLAFSWAWFRPALSDLWVGNVGRVELVMLAAFAVGARGRPAWRLAAAAVLGTLVAFKPNMAVVPVFVAVGWTLTGQRQRLLTLAVGGALGLAASVAGAAAFFGDGRIWLRWLERLPEITASDACAVAKGNAAAAALMAERLGLPAASQTAVAAALFLPLLALLAVAVRRPWGQVPTPPPPPAALDVTLIGYGCALSLLAAPLAWIHYFVLLLPLAMVAFRPRRPLAPVSRRLAALGAGGLGLLLLAEPTRPWLPDGEFASALLVATGAALTTTAAIIDPIRPSAANC
ncbi:MAG: hypothetical protein AAF628_36560 [Planctomycetota bacterium]